MATKSQTESGRTVEFTINPRERPDADSVDDDTPSHVLVEVTATAQTQMAILAAGPAGRYSFDFRISTQGIEIVRAYEEGMRANVDELPVWMTPVTEEVADVMLQME
ncbi:hypothetical protein SY89_01845 [Halolamina pelagica]|uniref:Uncharacterized protein n=1 Tax=Halolamina pelagica TaxID=699431 RepID=A0A0P7I2I7_9EURY|nr:hypothetical protein [Halolamina pelagica]KPN31103.1 hypothetical protein SY89_01845 [Halolamina pelagica]